MAIVDYLDWEVRTTGHDLNCSGFNPQRDPANGVDYTQQDNAAITSLNWQVDATNNTWIRSQELTNWVNGGGVLTSLKGNHIHLAGIAIAGGVLFSWSASTGRAGAYYLQAIGGGNPGWSTKPTRVWLNNVFTLEDTNLPAGSNTWAWGDFDSLGYSTIYVRFGAENDADPDTKLQDDVIADGQTWSRGAYEIINVGSDSSGPYLVLDRSPAAAGSTGGYGRIGGAMASPGGVGSILVVLSSYIKQTLILRSGTYTLTQLSATNLPNGMIGSAYAVVVGCDMTSKYNDPATRPQVYFGSFGVYHQAQIWFCDLYYTPTSASYTQNFTLVRCNVYNWKMNMLTSAYACYFENCSSLAGNGAYNYIKNCAVYEYSRLNMSFSILHNQLSSDERANFGLNYGGGMIYNSVVYISQSSGFGSHNDPMTLGIWDSCVAIGCAKFGFAFRAYAGPYVPAADRRQRIRRCFYYNCTLGGTNSQIGGADHVTLLPGNPFRDPDNGDFRLADNAAGNMLKQAGFQLPGPAGAPPIRFDVGAAQNSFYDIAGGQAAFLPPTYTKGA